MFWKLSFRQPCAIDSLLEKEVSTSIDTGWVEGEESQGEVKGEESQGEGCHSHSEFMYKGYPKLIVVFPIWSSHGSRYLPSLLPCLRFTLFYIYFLPHSSLLFSAPPPFPCPHRTALWMRFWTKMTFSRSASQTTRS